MARPLAKEIREAIVKAYERGAGTVAEVSEMFNVTSRTVFNYLRSHRETGDLTPVRPSGRPAILNDENLIIIKSIIMSNPDGTLQGYCDEFKKKTGIEVTFVTMHNACKKLNIRLKKKLLRARKK